jgi:hypothetical protein
MLPASPAPLLNAPVQCVRHGQEVLPIELNVWRDKRADPMEEGLAQFDGDLKGLGVDTGWLVLFDSRTGQPPLPQRTSSAKSSDPLRRHSPPQWQARNSQPSIKDIHVRINRSAERIPRTRGGTLVLSDIG